MKLGVEVRLEVCNQIQNPASEFGFVILLFYCGNVFRPVEVIKIELARRQILKIDALQKLQGGHALISVDPADKELGRSIAIVNVSKIRHKKSKLKESMFLLAS